MQKKTNLRIILTILLSLVDDALVFAIVLIVLPRLGIAIPIWSIALLAVFFLANILMGFWGLRKTPNKDLKI